MRIQNLLDLLPGQKKRRILSLRDPESRFTQIFRSNYWGNAESKSGFGSSLAATEEIRAKLPAIFRQHRVRTIFDAPCGDFNWMQHVVRETSVRYIGGDIVAPLIATNREKFGADSISFFKCDITNAAFPKADLWLCRHCLFHLSYNDIAASLKNFLSSEINLLLTTSHIPVSEKIINRNIRTSDFRLIDLFSDPFNFPDNYLFQCNDYVPPDCPMTLCLWNKEQLQGPIRRFVTYVEGLNPN